VRPGSLLQPQPVSMEAKSELKSDVKAAAKRDTATAS
jgi:hypothetical protein